MSLRRCLVVAFGLASLIVVGGVGSVQAATLTAPREYSEGDDEFFRGLHYVGNGNELNTVSVEKWGPGRLLFTDRSVDRIMIRNVPDCRHRSPRSVVCRPADDVSDMTFALGPRDDRLRIDARRTAGWILSIFVSAGPGDDSVRSRFEALMDGESGDDRLAVPASDEEVDTLTGGSGDDVLTGGWSVEGGLGNDTLRRARFLDGGPGRDRLFAHRDGSFLRGGSGSDLLVGGPGASTLGPIPGGGDYGAGSGNDRLDSVNGKTSDSPIDCGPGRDRIRADRRDRLLHCERVTRVRLPRGRS